MITNFNRIISLRFFSNKNGSRGAEYKDIAIKCPAYGRKPSVEISGLMTTDECMPSFNVTVKNLYIENVSSQYPFVEVEAGYYGKTARFTGTIFYMYTESPGPEGRTVIQCLMGNCENWLSATVTLNNLKKGFKLTDAINQIAISLGMTYKVSENCKGLVSSEDFQFTGKAKDSLVALKKHFKEPLVIKPNGSVLEVNLVGESSDLAPLLIPCVTTPPQLMGGADNAVIATIKTFYDPMVKPGTLVSFSSQYYSTNMNASTRKAITTMSVTTVNFNFSTTSGPNEMTLMGVIKK